MRFSNLLRSIKSDISTSSKVDWGAISSLSVGVIAALTGFRVAIYTQQSTSAALREARLLDSLKWFEERTQPRSIGLSIIEANWDSAKELRSTWTSVLVNQGIYLLAEKSKKEITEHERDNRRRIVKLLKNAELSGEQKMALADAVNKFQDNFKQRNEDLDQIDKEELKHWEGVVKGWGSSFVLVG